MERIKIVLKYKTGDAVLEFRKSLGLSQNKFLDKINDFADRVYTRNMLAKYEVGYCKMPLGMTMAVNKFAATLENNEGAKALNREVDRSILKLKKTIETQEEIIKGLQEELDKYKQIDE